MTGGKKKKINEKTVQMKCSSIKHKQRWHKHGKKYSKKLPELCS